MPARAVFLADCDRVDVHHVRVPLGLPLRRSSWRFAATILAGAQIIAYRVAQDLQARVDDAGLLVVWQRVAVAGFARATPPQEGIVSETPKSTQPSPKAEL